MTASEAFTRVEIAACGLGLHNRFNESLEPMQALGKVSKHFGHRWDSMEDDFRANRITPAQYCERAIQFIQTYRRIHLGDAVLKQLTELEAAQGLRGESA